MEGPLVVGAVVVAVCLVLVFAVRRTRGLGNEAERATFNALHIATLAAPHLREGLTVDGTRRAARHLRTLLGVPAVAISVPGRALAWDGQGGAEHMSSAPDHAARVFSDGRPAALGPKDIACTDLSCRIQHALIAPLTSGGKVIGALAAYTADPSASLARATEEVAEWVSVNLELAELDSERTRAMEAELKALRAQISPHFVYNSLAAIASFVRTDPARARDLLLEFADFTRYAFRSGGQLATLADELRNVERYVVLEQARFGEELTVKLKVPPETLNVSVPYLSVQPLVENAVRHGLAGGGTVSLTVHDLGAFVEVSVEDDGSGADPDVVRRALAGDSDTDSIGLGNVDARLRQVFGDDAGLVVETAPGAGTRVGFQVPKYHPGAPRPVRTE